MLGSRRKRTNLHEKYDHPFTVIDPRGTVVFADFRLDADRFVAALDADDADLQQRDG